MNDEAEKLPYVTRSLPQVIPTEMCERLQDWSARMSEHHFKVARLWDQFPVDMRPSILHHGRRPTRPRAAEYRNAQCLRE